jgi:4-amino-4-deoxy-L-arabinose transferase-like glycosyltransferase
VPDVTEARKRRAAATPARQLRFVGDEAAEPFAAPVAWPLDLSLRTKTRVALIGCAALAATLAFHRLEARGIFSPAEARYALIARQMVESGDWIQPRLNDVRYDEKPPLLYWTIATAYRWLGQSDFTSRLPSALGYVATTALTFWIASDLVGASVAPLAALVYATSVGTFLFGRFVFTDTLLIACTTLSLYGLVRLSRRPGEVAGASAFYGGMALAGLTKGFLGLVLPTATALSYAWLFEPPRFWRGLRPGLGVLIVAVVFLPWHVLLALRDPAFVDFYVMNEHVRRFLNTREPIDYVSLSIGGFWLATLFWLLPWALYLPTALARALRDDRRRLAIPLLWSAWVIGFFTVTRSRLEYYALPAAPALAVVVAAYWQRGFERRVASWELQLPALILLGAATAAIPKLFLFPRGGLDLLTAMVMNVDGYYREYFARHPDDSFALAREALSLARPFALLLALMGGGSALLVSMGRRRLAFALLVAASVPCLGFVDLGMRRVAVDRSQREFARVVDGNWRDDARLVVVGDYEDLCGITYYTRRPTLMFDENPQDLLWGHKRGDAPERWLTEEDLRRLWDSPSRVFVMSDRSFSLPGGTDLAESPRDVLRTNHPLAAVAQMPLAR